MPEDIVELEDEKQNRVRACQGCTTSLINQWTVYQRDQVPIDDRTYIYESPLGNKSEFCQNSEYVHFYHKILQSCFIHSRFWQMTIMKLRS